MFPNTWTVGFSINPKVEWVFIYPISTDYVTIPGFFRFKNVPKNYGSLICCHVGNTSKFTNLISRPTFGAMPHGICNQGTKEAKGVQILGLGTAWKQVFIHFVGRKTGKMSKNRRNLFFGGPVVVDGCLPHHLNDLGSSSQIITPRTTTHHLFRRCLWCMQVTKENISKNQQQKSWIKVNSRWQLRIHSTPTTLLLQKASASFGFQDFYVFLGSHTHGNQDL